jgi:predicted nuclease of restriction endonuclease-like RecB superfamily
VIAKKNTHGPTSNTDTAPRSGSLTSTAASTPRPGPELARQPGTDVRLYDMTDHEWIASIVDQVVSCQGMPWRALRERVEHGAIRSERAAAILGAVRRIMGGRADRMRVARKLRSIVLGTPALDAESRAERFAAAEEELGIAVDELESLLWIDLADERPVALPNGRPDEMTLAAFANVDRIARAVRRAHRVRIHTGGDSQPLVRAARRFGLIVSVLPRAGSDGLDTTLDILGPLSLFHATRVYGRALAALVPYLAGCTRFVLEIDADFGYGPAALRVSSPVLLPPAPTDASVQRLATRVQSALVKERPALVVMLDPPSIGGANERLFPDLLVHKAVGDDWFVEIVGFATSELLQRRLARYEAAGIKRVVLLVDERYAAPHAISSGAKRIVAYRSRSAAMELLKIMESL